MRVKAQERSARVGFVCWIVLIAAGTCFGVEWQFASRAPNPFQTIYTVSKGDTIYVLGDEQDLLPLCPNTDALNLISLNEEFDSVLPLMSRIWILNATSLEWSFVFSHGDVPEKRGYYCPYLVDDQIYVFAGTSWEGLVATNKMDVLNTTDFSWRKVEYATINKPKPIIQMACASYEKSMFVLGGYNGVQVADFWEFDIESGKWKKILPKPGNEDFAAALSYTQMSTYQDSLVVFGGCDLYYYFSPTLWTYNITAREWKAPIEFENVKPTVFTMSISVYRDYLFVFGGGYDLGLSRKSSDLTVINLHDGSASVIPSENPNFMENYPIISPLARYYSAASVANNKLIVLGGKNSKTLNDFWVFDPETFEWTDSSLSRYPYGRTRPHLTSMTENKIGMFGGQIYLDEAQPINDLWIYHTDTSKWERIVQESVCSPWQTNCAPAVLDAAFGFHNDTFYLIGGYFPGNESPIFRMFSTNSRAWSVIEELSGDFLESGLRYQSATAIIGSKIYIWGGMNSNNTSPSENIFVFEMNNSTGHQISSKSNAPELRTHPKGFSRDDSFCFVDTSIRDDPSSGREIWCFDEDINLWSMKENVDADVPDEAILSGFSTSLMIFGGLDEDDNIVSDFWINNIDTHIWKKVEQKVRPPPLVYSSSIIHFGTIFIFGGVSNDVSLVTSSVYSLELRKLWCDGNYSVSSLSSEVSDGSGDFDYFPGTQCSWTINNGNFIVVEQMNLNLGATLSLETLSECDKNLVIDNMESNKIGLSQHTNGTVVEIPSSNSILRFQVSKDAKSGGGFKMRIFSCKKGFRADLDGCYCETNRHINFRGDCVYCPTGSYQPNRNQENCLKENDDSFHKKDPQAIQQTETLELSIELPPIVFGGACKINSSIYVVGGSSSANKDSYDNYYEMDTFYVTESAVKSLWDKKKLSGDAPSKRIQFCLVGMESYGVLIGGKTLERDRHIYIMDISNNRWVKKSNTSAELIGPLCARNDDTIYVYGGTDLRGLVQNTLFAYKPDIDEWKFIQTSDVLPRLAFGSMAIYDSRIVLFGGTNGEDENGSVYVLGMENYEKEKSEIVKIQTCIGCDEEGGICDFSRRNFAFGLFKGQLHTFGGIKQGEVLADINIIDIETSEVVYRENYGLKNPELPLSHPPPKYGASYVMLESSLMIIGGASKSSIVSNDVWTWDGDVKTWSDSSVSRSPIHRTESGLVKISEGAFIIFGGATEYIEEVLLNDVWVFDIGNQTWSCLFPGSSVDGPSPRARAMLLLDAHTVYIYGGRKEAGVSDEKLWLFDLESNKWSEKNYQGLLSSYQRPFSRLGMGSTQIGSKLWMWGGQIAQGTKRTEFYSAALVFDQNSNSIYAANITGVLPSKRVYHALCSVDESNILMFGGKDFSGNNLNDAWIYNTESQSWNTTTYSSSTLPQLSNHICGDFKKSSVIEGVGTSNAKKELIILQHEYRKSARLKVSNLVLGYESIYKQASATFDNLMVSFGGTNGISTTNQVVAYRPGFCSSKPSVIFSTQDISMFDDGSGDAMYLENSNCTWILPNATHIIIGNKIRYADSIQVYPLVNGKADTLALRPFKSEKPNSDLYESPSGFFIRFTSAKSSSSVIDAPCNGCEGFVVSHAACPSNSNLGFGDSSCKCNPGYTAHEGFCNKDSTTSTINYFGIIGGVSGGGLVLILCLLGFYYRKKMRQNLEGAEKKLFGIVDPSELVYGRSLGSGSFGEVFQGEWRGTEVAIKVLLPNKINKEQIESFKREVAIMVELRHPNIVLYMGACFEAENLCLICELMQNGSLYDVIHQGRAISFSQKMQFMSDISKGMQYLHMSNPPIIHRDLKSLNILVDDRFRLKVSDFGLTTIQGSGNQEQNGSLLWLAPEVIEGREYTAKADVYSFGIIGWEIMAQKKPFEEVENVFAVTIQVLTNQLRPTMPSNVPKEISELICDLWNQDPNKRPTFQETSKRISTFVDKSRSPSSAYSVSMVYDNEAVPEGNVAVLCTRIYGSEKLWEDIPEAMGDAVTLHNSLIRDVCTRYQAYISHNDGEHFCVVFQDSMQAVKFSSTLYVLLNDIKWPKELLEHEYASPVAEGHMKGLRIQTGIEFGICNVIDDANQHKRFAGKVVSRASSVSKLSQGGQVLISEAFHQTLLDKMIELDSEYTIRIVRSKDPPNERHQLYEIVPNKLIKRLKYFEEHMSQLHMSTYSNDSSANSSNANQHPHAPMSRFLDSKTHKNEPSATPSEKETRVSLNVDRSWEIDMRDVSVHQKSIGSGSFGSVFLGEYKGKRVAVKKIAGGKSDDRHITSLLFEISILRRVKHPNIVEFIGASTDTSNLAIITEIVEPGNLRSVLQNYSLALTQSDKKKIIDGIICGMNYLHSQTPLILHRDLKSTNILVNEKYESKLCDFGFARIKANNRTMTKCGTVVYQAPEVLKGLRYNEKADVYSFGILLWEIETREIPHHGKNTFLLQLEIINGLRPAIRNGMDETIVDTMKKCWDGNPEARPAFADLMGRKLRIEFVEVD